MRGVILHTAMLLAASATLARAQSLDPTPGTEPPIELDGSIGPGGDVPFVDGVWQIGDQLGEYRGDSLLHSFGRFHVLAQQVAEFSAANGSPERVIARVTWGEPSEIEGTLRSVIPGADLYLINPAGVSFEGGAQLDVKGSLYVASVGRVDFGADESFSASPSDPLPLLTTESPVRFGFLPSGGGPIEVHPLDAPLSVDPGETLAAIGGSVRVAGSNFATLESPGSRIALVAGGPGVEIPADLASFDPAAIDPSVPLGAVEIALDSAVRVSVAESASGSLVARGGSFTLKDRSKIIAAHDQSADSSYARAVDIAVRDGLRIEGSSLIQVGSNGIRDDAQGYHARGGDLYLNGGAIEIEGSEILAFTRSGDGSEIHVQADALHLREGGRLITRSTGTGPGGAIFVGEIGTPPSEAGTLTLESGGRIVSEATRSGAGGALHVVASRIDASDVPGNAADSVIASSTTSRALAPRGGDAGSISVHAGELDLRDGAQIYSSTSGSGSSGRIDVHAKTLGLTGGTLDAQGMVQSTSIETRALPFSTGDAGQPVDATLEGVVIQADRLRVADGARISTSTQGEGRAGDLRLEVADAIALEGPVPAEVSSRSLAGSGFAGAGGRIAIETGALSVAGGSQITSSTDGTSRAGSVAIGADRVEIRGRSGANTSGVFSQSLAQDLPEGGDAGSVVIAARGDVALRDGGSVGVRTTSGGNAGTAEIHAPHGRVLLDDGTITASTEWTGDAGDVVVSADELEIRGDQGGIFAQTLATGREDGGDAGSIRITTAHDVFLHDTGGDTGTGGIFVETNNGGSAGTVVIDAGGRVRLDASRITASATEDARAPSGSIDITAAQGVFLQNRSVIGSRTAGRGQAGTIFIDAGPVFEASDSSVTTAASTQATKGGGVIEIAATQRIVLTDSEISSSVSAGDSNGGDIGIPEVPPEFAAAGAAGAPPGPRLMVVNRSQVIAKAQQGDGGRIFIRAGTFIVSGGSEISADSEGGGIDGTVVIDSPDAELNSERAEPVQEFLDAAGLLRTSCGAAGAASGSFIVSRVAGLPASPEGPLPAPLWSALAESGAAVGPAPLSHAADADALRVSARADGCRGREEL